MNSLFSTAQKIDPEMLKPRPKTASGTSSSIPTPTFGDILAARNKKKMQILTKTLMEFREADMRKKLKNCERVKVMAYQHQGPYKEGDKV